MHEGNAHNLTTKNEADISKCYVWPNIRASIFPTRHQAQNVAKQNVSDTSNPS